MLTSILAILALSVSDPASAAATPSPQDVSAFAPREAYTQDGETALSRVLAAQARAAARDARLVVIIGAEWCDDSRAMADFFADPVFAAQMRDDYEVEFVNAGSFDHGLDIVQHYGLPAYYATPTVLVIEPETSRVLNLDTQTYWRSATQRELSQAETYFADLSTQPAQEDASPALSAALADIAAFEADYAPHIYQGYAYMREHAGKEDGEKPENFLDVWREFKDARYTISQALSDLRADARRQDSEGLDPIVLEFPELDREWSWQEG
ncbi:thioredoxin family protein [Woodsholea maritima]|uniref:thioredoxin family protein n=1 Tax=Woodsholea maritima TaxID=240237 RepID=UPI00035CE7F1|nr:thioredoxin family protein [Woodsholea maritima]